MRKKTEIKETIFNDIKEEYKQGVSIRKLSNKYKISGYIISDRLKSIGVDVINRQNHLHFKDSDAISMYNNGLSITKISNILCTNRNNLIRRLKKNGFKHVNRQNEPKFNYHVFDVIDTEEKAYWLGFIFADGNISSPRKTKKKQYSFELSLSIKDENHLMKFNKFMGHRSNNIKSDNVRCRFSVSNKHLWTVLNNYGCTPKKSLTLKFPNHNIFNNKTLIYHFIRGYFDGDGSIYIGKHNVLTISFLGTYDFLDNIRNILNVPDKKIFKRGSINVLRIHSSFGMEALNCFYNNAGIYLDRKKEKFDLVKSIYDGKRNTSNKRSKVVC